MTILSQDKKIIVDTRNGYIRRDDGILYFVTSANGKMISLGDYGEDAGLVLADIADAISQYRVMAIYRMPERWEK